MNLLSKAEIKIIEAYQFLAKLFGKKNCCRFYPTCSDYYKESIAKNGLIKGNIRGIARILRCNQYFPGGYDPV
jgi:putative membrane protein insertion efficiency factor